ncbi:MerR family transcriptional regulator [Streptomyces sp. NBC_00448]|uniref:MerR family transcriptional regulator n=1 Tax=Streptomyces sp. NBC_00448 TaxID=2903652 RepID=UPI002E1E147B
MRIGALSARTDTPRRLLRYYEEQDLIHVPRCANGYRDYPEALVDTILHIRGLLDAGLPTRIIKQLLPCLTKPSVIHIPDATPEIVSTLQTERDRMTARIATLTRNRDAITDYLTAVLAPAAEATTDEATTDAVTAPRTRTTA